MKKSIVRLLLLISFSLLIFLPLKAQEANQQKKGDELYKEIATMDSILFDAFNHQNMDRFSSLFTTDLEWYQDNAGLLSYDVVFKTFDTNFHSENKLSRELVKGSLEVYPVKDYGAIETGIHKFSHVENGELITGSFKFVMLWKRTADGLKISRVISYDH